MPNHINKDKRISAMEKYKISDTLASGSTSKVKKIRDRENKKYAVKIILKEFHDKKMTEKEIAIHRSLKHPNILLFIEMIEDVSSYNLILQLATYELMDVIVSDRGAKPEIAHFYFKQLISAVSFLHGKGICHRDIKIDNLLIDQNGNLLLCDFGAATLFMHKGKRRSLMTYAGSPPYMAPEVLTGRYEGDEVDLWSCGVVLAILYCGTLLWNEPVDSDERFDAFCRLKYHNYAPFNRIEFDALCLTKHLLCLEPSRRYKIKDIERNEWFLRENEFIDKNGLCRDGRALSFFQKKILMYSQPIHADSKISKDFVLSQPINDTVFPSVKRIYMQATTTFAISAVEDVLKNGVVQFNSSRDGLIFTTTDTNRIVLKGEICFKSILDVTCITFCKINGCSLEFRRLVDLVCGSINKIKRI